MAKIHFFVVCFSLLSDKAHNSIKTLTIEAKINNSRHGVIPPLNRSLIEARNGFTASLLPSGVFVS